jgi:hypothetical protein
MPRSLNEIIAQADELATRFENMEPGEAKDAAPLRRIGEAVAQRTEAEKQIVVAIEQARNAGHSWAAIGAFLGTSGEAARQKYGTLISH